jgi:hypothetical protein
VKNKHKHPLFNTWHGMKQRCNNPNAPGYRLYGGKGIKVCKEWSESFDAFILDMGERPKGMTLDRLNSHGNYEKSNCRWATHKQQADNRTYTRWLPYGGVVKTLTEWANIFELDRKYLYTRIFRLGWSVEDALTKPIRGKKKSVVH